MNAKTSDEKLAEELAQMNAVGNTNTGAEPQKQNVSFAEALRESGQTVEEIKASGDGKKTRAKKEKNDGEAPKVLTPRVKIAPGSTPSQVLAQHITDAEQLHAAAQLEVGDAATAENWAGVAGRIDALAKKIGEKAVNMLRNRKNPSAWQVYTKVGMEMLLENGTMTSAELTRHYNSTKYTIGTARAQCNQIMTLLPALRVANVTSKGTLEVNENSTIVRDYRAAIAK